MFRIAVTETRSHRLVVILIIMSVLHVADLALTQHQVRQGCFIEANRVAAALIDMPLGLALYKLGSYGLGVLILYMLRRHWQGEAAAWLLLSVSVGLMIWWGYFLHYQAICLADPYSVPAAIISS